jgi:tRNA dimethylallyltransferase
VITPVLSDSPIPVLVFFGPTASGKTDLLFRLFSPSDGILKAYQAELVSADSMQVYRGMDIGTAKPSAEERSLLPHHLIDIRNPDEQFNAGDFVRLADAACLAIFRRGGLPVVSGGTGFYLKNFIQGLPQTPPSNPEIRALLMAELSEKGAQALMAELAAGDPVSAGRIHINDEYRLLRALEVLRVSGRPLSSFQVSGSAQAPGSVPGPGESRPNYRFLIIGLSRPREELYRRINLRCTEMFRKGLPGEVQGLFEAGHSPAEPGLRAIGYREFFIEDEAGSYRLSQDLVGVEALVAQNSRRYAKRQITFFSPLSDVKWIEAGNKKPEDLARIIGDEIASCFPLSPT